MVTKETCLLYLKQIRVDIGFLLVIVLIGIAIPTIVLDDIHAWYETIPGQVVTISFIHEVTGIAYTAESFEKDPSYDRTFVNSETISSAQLFGLSAILPLVYIIIFLWIISKVKPKGDKQYKLFRSEWVVFEFVTFCYALGIAMSINYWLNKTLKIVVSMPIPDFYQRCGLDTTDPHNPICTNADENEVFKAFKSFPSGHSSNLFTMGTTVVFYTWNKINLFDTLRFDFLHHRWYYRSFIDILLLWPIFLAAWGACSRVTDHVHTPTDILGGACVGYLAGRIGYSTQYKNGSPWSYRLLFWPQIRRIIEKHQTLKRKMYPQMFQHKTNFLLQEMTKYKFEERKEKRRAGRHGNNANSAEMEEDPAATELAPTHQT